MINFWEEYHEVIFTKKIVREVTLFVLPARDMLNSNVNNFAPT